MTYEQAIAHIVGNWVQLYEEQCKLRYGSFPKMVSVWCAKSDRAHNYDVDEELIGVTPQGEIAWAFASDCSCWNGEYSEERRPSIKELKLEHEHATQEWQDAIVKFAETHVMQDL